MLIETIIKLEDTRYSSAEDKVEFIAQEIKNTIEECIEEIEYFEELMLDSLTNFCNTGKFLTKE